jgi:small subunit ribosomal protein S13
MAEDKRNIEEQEVRLIRIMSRDLRGDKTVYNALTRIKGISWSVCNAICRKLKIPKDKKVEELTADEKKKIEDFMSKPDLPLFLKNRRKDVDSGEDKHLSGADLDLQKEFDIKKEKKIRSYKGVRHLQGLPVRGQRTKANFRKNKKKTGAVGVRKK